MHTEGATPRRLWPNTAVDSADRQDKTTPAPNTKAEPDQDKKQPGDTSQAAIDRKRKPRDRAN